MCLVLGSESKVNDKLSIKGKIDCNGKTTIVGKYKICGGANLALGT